MEEELSNPTHTTGRDYSNITSLNIHIPKAVKIGVNRKIILQ